MNFFRGLKTKLRRLDDNDCRILYVDQEDSHSVRMFEPGIVNIETEEFYMKLRDRKYLYAIEDFESNFVGTVHFNEVDKKNGVFDIGIRILSGYQGNGYGKDAVRLILRFGFFELRLHKANSDLLAVNEASNRLHESLGFVLEGVRRQTVFTDGMYLDEKLYGMTREEFEASNSEWLTSVANYV